MFVNVLNSPLEYWNFFYWRFFVPREMYSMSIAHSVHFSSCLLDLNIFSRLLLGAVLVLNEVSQ